MKSQAFALARGAKWVDRCTSKGLAGLQEHSSRPQQLCRPAPQAGILHIEALRRQRLTGKAISDPPPNIF